MVYFLAEFDEEMQSETGSRYSLANISRNSTVSSLMRPRKKVVCFLFPNCFYLKFFFEF